MRCTINEMVERLGVERDKVYGLVAYLIATGHIQIVDKIPPPNGKGKSSNVYEIPESITINFGEK